MGTCGSKSRLVHNRDYDDPEPLELCPESDHTYCYTCPHCSEKAADMISLVHLSHRNWKSGIPPGDATLLDCVVCTGCEREAIIYCHDERVLVPYISTGNVDWCLEREQPKLNLFVKDGSEIEIQTASLGPWCHGHNIGRSSPSKGDTRIDYSAVEPGACPSNVASTRECYECGSKFFLCYDPMPSVKSNDETCRFRLFYLRINASVSGCDSVGNLTSKLTCV